jgi:hypothetical protein
LPVILDGRLPRWASREAVLWLLDASVNERVCSACSSASLSSASAMLLFVSPEMTTWPPDTPVSEGRSLAKGKGWPRSPRVFDGAHPVWVLRGSGPVPARLAGQRRGRARLVRACLRRSFSTGSLRDPEFRSPPNIFWCWKGCNPLQGEGWPRLPQVLTVSASCGCWGERFCGCSTLVNGESVLDSFECGPLVVFSSSCPSLHPQR